MTVSDNYLSVDGVRIHYLEAGSGPRAIVLSHGNSHCGGVWLPLLQALAGDQLRVVALDLRGHGWSDKPDEGYDWPRLRDDLVAVVRALGLREVVYAGHSRGGGVSLLAAAATPDVTRGVFVFEPTVAVLPGEDGRPVPQPVPARIKEMLERTSRRRERFPSRDALGAHYRSRDGFSAWRGDYFQAFIEYGTIVHPDGSASPCVPARVAARLFEATFGFEPWRDVHMPDLPVQVLFGANSGRLSPDRDPMAPIHCLYPRAEMSVMPDATHTGPMEHPEQFEAGLHLFASRLLGSADLESLESNEGAPHGDRP
jgi:pimeloyl-ACP methyl ester carboxylesterase